MSYRVGPSERNMAPSQPKGRGLNQRLSHSLRRRNAAGVEDRTPVNPVVKYFIFFVNVVFLLVGLGLVGITAYILNQKENSIDSFVVFIFDPPSVLCLVGCIITFTAFLACWGSLRENTTTLSGYYILASLLLLLEIVIIVFIFVFFFVENSFANIGFYPEDALKEAVEKYRDNEDMQGFIDNIQDVLSCCGASNDDLGYKDWNNNIYFKCDGTAENPMPEACSVPFSCCRLSEGENINYQCGAEMLKDDVTNKTGIYTIGCLKGLHLVIQDNIWIFGGVILGILIPQVLLITLGKGLVGQIEEQKSKW